MLVCIMVGCYVKGGGIGLQQRRHREETGRDVEGIELEWTEIEQAWRWEGAGTKGIGLARNGDGKRLKNG